MFGHRYWGKKVGTSRIGFYHAGEKSHSKPHTAAHKEKGLTGATANPSSLFGFFGGAEGDRTPDLMTASHALSQLSYSPENENAT